MKRVFPLIPAVAALCIVFCGLEARCQPDTAPDTSAEPAQQPGEIPYTEQSDNELRLLNYILTEEAWHYRVFGLFRLERFTGDEADQAVLKALEDEAWQVRCFAIRAAVRRGLTIPEGKFDAESEPRVIRMAQRVEVAVDVEQVRKIAEKEMRSKVPERAILGIEIAVRSGDDKLRSRAKKRLGQVLTNIDNAVLVTIGDRLGALLGLDRQPATVEAWRQYIKTNGKNLSFPEFEPQTGQVREQPLAPIAMMDAKAFPEAVNYLDNLHQQDLETAVVIDGTGSMGHVIHRAQGQTNRLMLTLNDLAQSMKMGVIIYRDQGDRPMLEAVKLTDNIGKVRSFLFEVEASGGGDFPEAVYEGLSAMRQLNWSSKAVKQAVLITDAPAHEENMGTIKGMVKEMRSDGLTMHGLMVGRAPQMVDTLKKITNWGGGTLVPLEASDDLGKLVVRFIIDPKLHDTFDHLYDLYVELGM